MTENRRTRQDWNELSRQNEKLQQENERLRHILRSICRTMAQYSNECGEFTEESRENPS
jgi:predicted RNase H-like nuclease (RuvC/YqgF family)